MEKKIEIKTLKKIEKDWDNFVAKNQYSTIFHTSQWLNYLENAFDLEIKIIAMRDNGEICTGLPFSIRQDYKLKQFESLPFSDCGGLLVTDNDNLKEIILQISKLNVDHVDIRTINNGIAKCFKSEGYYDNSTLCIPYSDISKGYEFIWNNVFSKKRQERKKIARSEKRGVKIEEVYLKDVQEEFYHLYTETIKRNKGFPQKKTVFLNLQKEIPSFKIFAAEYNKEYISFLTAVTYKSNVYLLHNSSVVGGKYNNLYHNWAIYWYSIKWACDNSFTTINWGSTPNDTNNGIYKFKLHFGAKPIKLYEFNKSFTLKGEIINKILQEIKFLYPKIPINLSKYITRDKIPI
jgi:hypothetical protein